MAKCDQPGGKNRRCAERSPWQRIDELGLLDIKPTAKAYKSYRQALAQVMAELVSQGDTVIVGRAGQVILGQRQDVLHICAPELSAAQCAGEKSGWTKPDILGNRTGTE